MAQDASPHDTYTSPLASRNASPAMLRLWSPRHRFGLWRRIWLALAEAQHDAGLPVTADQVEALRANLDVSDEDLARAGEHERRLRHDVMAHVHALGDACPEARGVIHLGMTSQDVVCNADILVLREAWTLTQAKLARAVLALGDAATRWKALPTLGMTHYQPAQPTTVGRRAAMWAHELWLCLERMEHTAASGALRMRGLRGATGTQASFLSLMEGDAAGVQRLESAFLERLVGRDDASNTHGPTGQTYPRICDAFLLSDLAAAASVLHRIGTDLRLLCNRREIDEPFGSSQIGSSAMPYKRNPMRCERMCGLTRFVMSLASNAAQTEATQWLERTLDDSSNRRLSLPEAFLALDGALDLMHNVADGLVVHEAMVRRNLEAEMPFLATENLMMAAVRLGRDRQEVHEAIRGHAMAAAGRMKGEGADNDLRERLRDEPLLDGVDMDAALDPSGFVGLAVEQVDAFERGILSKVRTDYAKTLATLGESDRGV